MGAANLGDFGRALRDPNKVDGPLFRVFSKAADLTYEQAHSYYSGAQNAAGPVPTRVFPDMDQILSGATNAHTGLCDMSDSAQVRDCYSEFLPTAAYEGNGNGGFDFRSPRGTSARTAGASPSRACTSASTGRPVRSRSRARRMPGSR